MGGRWGLEARTGGGGGERRSLLADTELPCEPSVGSSGALSSEGGESAGAAVSDRRLRRRRGVWVSRGSPVVVLVVSGGCSTGFAVLRPVLVP